MDKLESRKGPQVLNGTYSSDLSPEYGRVGTRARNAVMSDRDGKREV